MKRLQEFNASAIPQQNAPMDPRSSPSKFNGVWTPWEGDPDPRKCAWPPPPPPVACLGGQCIGNLDGILLNQTAGATNCAVQGWCSGKGYTGPSMLVQLKLDGKDYGKTVVADIHRTIAGNHGFHIPFECSVVRNGNHTFAAIARLNSSAPTFNVGQLCTSNGHQSAC